MYLIWKTNLVAKIKLFLCFIMPLDSGVCCEYKGSKSAVSDQLLLSYIRLNISNPDVTI